MITLVAVLSTSLAAVSAIAGGLWARSRSWPMARAAGLARDLMTRQEALEALIVRLEARLDAESSKAGGVPSGPLGARSKAEAEAGAAPAPRPDTAPAPAGKTLISVPDLSVVAPREGPPGEAGDLESRFGEVWALAAAGRGAEEIARELGQPVGRVELILGLRRRATATATATATAGRP